MSELKTALTKAGLEDVQTYIQSGNVIFKSKSEATDTDKFASFIKNTIYKNFGLSVDVAVFSAQEWRDIIDAAPAWWGEDQAWKHNILIMIKPYDMRDIVSAIGELQPDAEAIKAGKGIVYQSVAWAMVGKAATGSKLASRPIYKQMTIRNYNTATKLLVLLEKSGL